MERSETAPLRLTTTDMAYGPHAVARNDGKVVFVRNAAPGEVLEARITEERRSFAFADTVAVIEPSADRRTAPCPYLPRCGGCPWQHLTYAAQLAAKQRIVAEHLRRIAKLEVPVAPPIAAPQEFGGRRRIKLRVEDRQLGYYAGASHELVPVARCLLGGTAIDAAFGAAAELVRRLAVALRRLELIACDEHSDRVVLAGEVEGAWVADDEARCSKWLSDHTAVQGLALHGRGWQRHWGDLRIAVTPEADLTLLAHAPAFTQVNPAMNRELVRSVVEAADLRPSDRVLDLYAGIGNLSFPLRRRSAAVTAIEQNRRAADDALANAARLPDLPVQVICERAERALVQLARQGARFDAVVLDPPRSGAAACVETILHVAPARLVYVSCDPSTLARDLAALAERYKIDSVQPLDLFPHSYHVETVVRASLSCHSGTPDVSSARRHQSAEPRRRRRTRGRT